MLWYDRYLTGYKKGIFFQCLHTPIRKMVISLESAEAGDQNVMVLTHCVTITQSP